MTKWLWIIGALMTFIPVAIAYKRKCANFVLIDLQFLLSWTIIGWWPRWLGYMGEPIRRITQTRLS
jgi:hypothetical protein